MKNSSPIVIINYGMGNLGSVRNMFKHIGTDAVISDKADDINSAGKLVLAGVGAFDNGIQNIKKLGLFDILNKKVLEEKIPILGICLGMQLFSIRSEEGKLDGLGWIDSETIKFRFAPNSEQRLRIPHMGWNLVNIMKPGRLAAEMKENQKFYFVHSYHLTCKNESDVLFTSNYGYDFVCGIEKDNILGVQFHPEKSHKFGMQILKNFVNI
jgi:glutamine amidotransferase